MRTVLFRLALIPLAAALGHFFGFAYAHLAAPIQAARSPVYAADGEPVGLVPAYAEHLGALLRLDLGVLPGTERPFLAAIGQAAINSLGLLALALTISVVLGLALGVGGVALSPPRIRPWLTVGASVGLAMPGVFLGNLLIVAVLAYLLYGPGPPPIVPIQGFGWDSHLVLPLIVLIARPTVQIAQLAAALLVGELGKQYIVAARSRGVPLRQLAGRHALRNAAAPIIQTVAGSLRLMVAELIIVEKLFAWPGLGLLIASAFIPSRISTSPEAALFLNPPTVAAAVACLALLFTLTDGLAALGARAADPRLRTA